MSKKLIYKTELLIVLKKFLSSIAMDHYNENTYNWSSGYRKGVEDSINIVKSAKEYDVK